MPWQFNLQPIRKEKRPLMINNIKTAERDEKNLTTVTFVSTVNPIEQSKKTIRQKK